MELNEKQIQILEAAEDLFALKGFEGASVRDIAGKANVNVAMISYYFGSKEKLLQSLLLNRTEKSRSLLNKLKKDPNIDPWEKIDRIIDFFVDHLVKGRKFQSIMVRQMSLVQDKKVIDMLIDLKMTNTTLIQDIIREGQRKNVFRKVNVPLTISSIIGTISQVTMSKPFYSKLLKLNCENESEFYEKLRPKLKTHLRSLVHNHLELKS